MSFPDRVVAEPDWRAPLDEPPAQTREELLTAVLRGEADLKPYNGPWEVVLQAEFDHDERFDNPAFEIAARLADASPAELVELKVRAAQWRDDVVRAAVAVERREAAKRDAERTRAQQLEAAHG